MPSTKEIFKALGLGPDATAAAASILGETECSARKYCNMVAEMVIPVIKERLDEAQGPVGREIRPIDSCDPDVRAAHKVLLLLHDAISAMSHNKYWGFQGGVDQITGKQDQYQWAHMAYALKHILSSFKPQIMVAAIKAQSVKSINDTAKVDKPKKKRLQPAGLTIKTEKQSLDIPGATALVRQTSLGLSSVFAINCDTQPHKKYNEVTYKVKVKRFKYEIPADELGSESSSLGEPCDVTPLSANPSGMALSVTPPPADPSGMALSVTPPPADLRGMALSVTPPPADPSGMALSVTPPAVDSEAEQPEEPLDHLPSPRT